MQYTNNKGNRTKLSSRNLTDGHHDTNTDTQKVEKLKFIIRKYLWRKHISWSNYENALILLEQNKEECDFVDVGFS